MSLKDKQKLFETLSKINPELKGKKLIIEEYIGEADQSLQRFLGDLGFTDMYNMYKNDPKQLDRIFTKILPANKLKTFKKLLNPGQPVQRAQQVQQKPVGDRITGFVNELPDDFPRVYSRMDEDEIDYYFLSLIEDFGDAIGVTNDEEAQAFQVELGNNFDKFMKLVDRKFGKGATNWGYREQEIPKLEEELDANAIKIYSIDDVRNTPALRSNAANGFLMPIFNKGEKVAFGFIDSPEEYQGPGNVKAVKQLNGKIRIVRGPEY